MRFRTHGKSGQKSESHSKKPEGGHGTLCRGAYDREYTEKMMGGLETAGFNTLRGAGDL